MKRDLIAAAKLLDNPPHTPGAIVIPSAEGGMLFEGVSHFDERKTDAGTD